MLKKLSFSLVVSLVVAGCSFTAQPIVEPEVQDKEETVKQEDIKEEPKPVVKPKPVKPKKTVMGWVEYVEIGNIEDMPKAKLDSGAETSSIDAEIVRIFEKEGKEHVLFRVNFDGTPEGLHTIEAPIERWVRIKRKGGEGDYIRRPVIDMAFCLGNKRIHGEVNLADRGNFIYPVLIGRNMLSENIIVDTSKTYTQEPNC